MLDATDLPRGSAVICNIKYALSGTTPSLVIPIQTKCFKMLKSDTPKVPKQAEVKGDSVINQQNFNQFFSGKMIMLSKPSRINRSRP